jgi:hypothetical protein
VIEDVRLLAPSSLHEALIPQVEGARFDVEAPQRSPSKTVARAEIDCMSEKDLCVTRLLAPAFRF